MATQKHLFKIDEPVLVYHYEVENFLDIEYTYA